MEIGIWQLVIGAVTTILGSAIAVKLLFYHQNKQSLKLDNKAKEQNVVGESISNLSGFAAGWKELADRYEKTNIELESRLSECFADNRAKTDRNIKLSEENAKLIRENGEKDVKITKLEHEKCIVDECLKRRPPRKFPFKIT